MIKAHAFLAILLQSLVAPRIGQLGHGMPKSTLALPYSGMRFKSSGCFKRSKDATSMTSFLAKVHQKMQDDKLATASSSSKTNSKSSGSLATEASQVKVAKTSKTISNNVTTKKPPPSSSSEGDTIATESSKDLSASSSRRKQKPKGMRQPTRPTSQSNDSTRENQLHTTADLARSNSRKSLDQYLKIIQRSVKEEKPEEAEAVLIEMRRDNLKPSTECYSLTMKGYAAMNNVNQVERIFDLARREEVDDVSLWKLGLNSYIKVSDIDRAVTLISRLMDDKNLLPDDHPTLQLFETCIRARRWQDAGFAFGILSINGGLSKFSAKVKSNLEAHLKEFIHLACLLLKSDPNNGSERYSLSLDNPIGPDLGIVFYKSLAALGKPLPEGLYRATMKYYSDVRDLVAVVSTWTTMRNQIKTTPPSAPTTTVLLQAVVAKGADRSAKATLDMMTKEKLPLDVDGFRALLALMGRLGRDKDAISLLVDMSAKGNEFGVEEWQVLREGFRNGVWKSQERNVVRFLEENFPEVLEVVPDDEGLTNSNMVETEEDEDAGQAPAPAITTRKTYSSISKVVRIGSKPTSMNAVAA